MSENFAKEIVSTTNDLMEASRTLGFKEGERHVRQIVLELAQTLSATATNEQREIIQQFLEAMLLNLIGTEGEKEAKA